MLVNSEIQILFHNSVTQLAEVVVAATLRNVVIQ